MAHYPTDHRRGVSAGKAGVGVQVSEAKRDEARETKVALL